MTTIVTIVIYIVSMLTSMSLWWRNYSKTFVAVVDVKMIKKKGAVVEVARVVRLVFT